MANYGEVMLRRAESKRRAIRARRRRVTILLPAMFVTFWSMADLLAARHARLAEVQAGFVHMVTDHVEVLAWTFAFVIVPILLSIKPDPMPQGAGLALVAGPLLEPIVFGGGGWHLWQDTILLIVCSLVLLAARTRSRRAVFASA